MVISVEWQDLTRESERTCKEVIVVYIMVLSYRLPGRTEENYKPIQSGLPVSRSEFEPNFSNTKQEC
jgi:hypothetical protein